MLVPYTRWTAKRKNNENSKGQIMKNLMWLVEFGFLFCRRWGATESFRKMLLFIV